MSVRQFNPCTFTCAQSTSRARAGAARLDGASPPVEGELSMTPRRLVSSLRPSSMRVFRPLFGCAAGSRPPSLLLPRTAPEYAFPFISARPALRSLRHRRPARPAGNCRECARLTGRAGSAPTASRPLASGQDARARRDLTNPLLVRGLKAPYSTLQSRVFLTHCSVRTRSLNPTLSLHGGVA